MASLLALFNSFKKTGKSATLVLSTKGGDVTAKLEVKLINAKSSPSSTTTPSPTLLTSPGCQDSRDRQRPHRSAARRTKANARAAQHRLHQALPFPGGDYTAAVGPPPPRRPLRLHPSPKEENRRLMLTVDRKAGFRPTFYQLDWDGDPPPHTPTSEPSLSPCKNDEHCEICNNCLLLCPDHHGCRCDQNMVSKCVCRPCNQM